MMEARQTRLGAWARGVAEVAVLLAVACVPLFVNYYSHSVFERDKAAVTLILALVAGVAMVVSFLESPRGPMWARLKEPLPAAAAFTLLAWGVASALSTQPRFSIFGSYERAMGLLSLGALVVLFMAAADRAGEAGPRRRLIAVAVAACLPATVWALAQARGIQVVPGQVERVGRAFGTLSNPIFLGSYLALLLPVALALAIESWRRGAKIRAGAWAGSVLLIGVALVLTDSRGPMLGAAAGLGVGALATALAAGRRGLAGAVVALVVGGLAFLLVFNLPGSPLAPLREWPMIGRFGRLAATDVGPQRTRLAIWRGAARLAAAEPGRLIVGHGPETLKYALLPHLDPGVGGQGQAERLVDRSHNDLLDALLMTGILGAVAFVAFFAAWVDAAARAAGFAQEMPARRRLAAGMAAGFAAGLVVWALSPDYGPAASLLGLAAGAGAGILAAAWDRPPPGLRPLPLGLLAAGVGATVEAAFGIRSIAPAVVLWILAGVLAGWRGDDEAAPARAPTASEAGGSREVRLTLSGAGAVIGLVFGMAGCALAYATLAGAASTRPPEALPVAAAILVVTALSGGLAAASAGAGGAGAAILAGVLIGAFLGLRAILLAAGGVVTLLALFFLCLPLVALVAGLGLAPPAGRSVARGARALAYPVLAALAVAVGMILAARPVVVDMQFQAALEAFGLSLRSDDPAAFRTAEALYRDVEVSGGREPIYPMLWGELYATLGQATQDPQSMAVAFSRAQDLMQQAEVLEPALPYHAYNRGHLQLLFAQRLAPDQAKTVAENAVAALQTAFSGAPTDPHVAKDLAEARILAGNPQSARDLLTYVEELTPGDPDVAVLRGKSYQAEGSLDEAAEAFTEALQREGEKPRPETLVALGELERQRGNLAEARSWYEEAAIAAPEQWMIVFNLGLLYRDMNDTQRAVSTLTDALKAAPPAERGRIQQAIDAMLTGGAAPPAP